MTSHTIYRIFRLSLLFLVVTLLVGVAPQRVALAQDIRSECADKIDWNPTWPAFEKFDPPVTISVPFGTNAIFVGSDSYSNNPWRNFLSDYLGIDYQIHWQADGEARNQRFAADLAAGTLPDMFPAGLHNAFLPRLIEAGAIEDITDEWNQFASDLTKEKKGTPETQPVFWANAARGDVIYGIPFTYGPAYNIDNLGFIRQDYLDAVGLPIPTTIDELTAAMQAFKDAGLAEFGVNANQYLVTWEQSLDPIFGAFGVMPQTWLENEDGTLRYGSLDPGVKAALAQIQSWYAAGLMDPDYFTYNWGQSEANVVSGKVGVWFAPWWSLYQIESLQQQNPNARVSLLPPLAGPNGEVGRKASPSVGDVVVFRKGVDPRIIEAAIKQLNWQIEMRANFEQYQQYGEWRNGGWWFEGYDWVFDENCNMKLGPTNGNTYLYLAEGAMTFPFVVYPSYQADSFAAISRWLEADPATLNNAQKYLISNAHAVGEAIFYNYAVETADTAINDAFYGPYSDQMTQLMPDLFALEQRVFTEIVTGVSSVDAFDTFVQDWMAMGGDQVTADVNAWKAAQ